MRRQNRRKSANLVNPLFTLPDGSALWYEAYYKGLRQKLCLDFPCVRRYRSKDEINQLKLYGRNDASRQLLIFLDFSGSDFEIAMNFSSCVGLQAYLTDTFVKSGYGYYFLNQVGIPKVATVFEIPDGMNLTVRMLQDTLSDLGFYKIIPLINTHSTSISTSYVSQEEIEELAGYLKNLAPISPQIINYNEDEEYIKFETFPFRYPAYKMGNGIPRKVLKLFDLKKFQRKKLAFLNFLLSAPQLSGEFLICPKRLSTTLDITPSTASRFIRWSIQNGYLEQVCNKIYKATTQLANARLKM